mmetsp:Transcript_4125/g.11846  ORF Transcript_4125/g.11846 Transcript_4125/m.11846 type:complete len:200 (+) Transcript_4125:721-1320(+)
MVSVADTFTPRKARFMTASICSEVSRPAVCHSLRRSPSIFSGCVPTYAMYSRITSSAASCSMFSLMKAIRCLLFLSPSTRSCSISPTSASMNLLVVVLSCPLIWMCRLSCEMSAWYCGSAVMSPRIAPSDISPPPRAPPAPAETAACAALFLVWNSRKRSAMWRYTSATNMWRSSTHTESRSSIVVSLDSTRLLLDSNS